VRDFVLMCHGHATQTIIKHGDGDCLPVRASRHTGTLTIAEEEGDTWRMKTERGRSAMVAPEPWVIEVEA